MRTIHVWSETPYGATGEDFGDPTPDTRIYNDGHSLGTCHGSAVAESLQEAADKVFGGDPSYNRERMTYWLCKLFEREPKYR